MEIGGKLGVDVLKIIFPVAAIWPEVRSNFVILYLYYWISYLWYKQQKYDRISRRWHDADIYCKKNYTQAKINFLIITYKSIILQS